MPDTVVAKLIASEIASPATIRGCSEDEITAIEAQLGFPLPRSYRAFLAVLGREAGDFLRGTDFLWNDLPALRDQATRALRASPDLALDERDFVFAVHQGYTFVFFRCDGTDDPAVSAYDEEGFRSVAESFSTWLERAVDDESELSAEVPRRG